MGLSSRGNAIFLTTVAQFTPVSPYAIAPTPTTEPTMACVVDTGRPARLANPTHTPAPKIVAIAAATVGTIPLTNRPFPKVSIIAPESSARARPPNPVHTVPQSIAADN
jgi:hypothetical protein